MDIKMDLWSMMSRYAEYGWSKRAICRKWGMSVNTFYSFRSAFPHTQRSPRIQFNAITMAEKRAIRDYALTHTELRHREMAYRMIDEDVAYVSPSSVYRLLHENHLIPTRLMHQRPEGWNPHQSPGKADEVWQSDLTHLRYHQRSYYLLLFLDVYSRFIVFWRLCMQMTGESVKEAFQDALSQTGMNPLLQTDNGSCYVSHEFRHLLSKANIEHYLIHPHCPNENAEIERVNRTLKEDLDVSGAGSFAELFELIGKRIDYYNYQRYHSAIGFITPYTKYRGNPEKIFQERQKKLERAKQARIKQNWLNFESKLIEKSYPINFQSV